MMALRETSRSALQFRAAPSKYSVVRCPHKWITSAGLSISSFARLFRPPRAFRMPQVGTFFLFLWRDLGGLFTGWNGIASHRFLEPGR